jgi:hypothetical protein
MAKLVPPDADRDDIYNFLAGKRTLEGDVVSAVLDDQWGSS